VEEEKEAEKEQKAAQVYKREEFPKSCIGLSKRNQSYHEILGNLSLSENNTQQHFVNTSD
jgi:hypothetical protein